VPQAWAPDFGAAPILELRRAPCPRDLDRQAVHIAESIGALALALAGLRGTCSMQIPRGMHASLAEE
jgi:hypothetical protein